MKVTIYCENGMKAVFVDAKNATGEVIDLNVLPHAKREQIKKALRKRVIEGKEFRIL